MNKNLVVVLLFVFCFFSCKEESSVKDKFVNILTLTDCTPPVITGMETVDQNNVQICFDEVVFPVESSFSDCVATSYGCVVNISFSERLKAGESRFILGTVHDRYGNSNTFRTLFWGKNNNCANLQITEFTTKGSKNQPDRIELKVARSGNLAGMVLYNGTPTSYKNKVIFPDVYVKKGDYVVIWCCDEKPSDFKENDMNILNIRCSGGLSENNGIVCLFSSPMSDAQIVSCVVWSNRESSQYEGYGTKEVYLRVKEAIENRWWNTEPINSSYSTSTRSMALDSNGNWYTTVQGGITFGKENNSPPYNAE